MDNDPLRDFLDWRMHVKEFYQGLIMYALHDKPVSMNFFGPTQHIKSSSIFSIVMSNKNMNDANSTINLWTATFPNRYAPEFNPAQPEEKWGKFIENSRIPINGTIICCTADSDSNINAGTDKEIMSIQMNGRTCIQISSPSYLVRSFGSNFPIFVLKDGNIVSFDTRRSSINRLYSVDQTILDLTQSTMDTNTILYTQGKKHASVLDIRSQSEIQIKMNHHISSVALSPNLSYLFAAGHNDGHVNLYDIRFPILPLHSIAPHDHPVTSLKWSPFDPDVLACASSDTAVTICSFRGNTNKENQCVFAHNGHVSPIIEFDWSRDTKWTLASVSEDNLFEIWSISLSQIEELV